jgi:hypothetical protein
MKGRVYLFPLLMLQGTFCLRGSLNVPKLEAGRNIPPHSPEDRKIDLVLLKGPKLEIFVAEFFYTIHVCIGR